MSYIGLLLVVAVNCLILFFASLLAAGGDGSMDGIKTVWRYGFAWIAVFGVAGLVLCIRGKADAGISLVAATLPAAFVIAQFFSRMGWFAH